MKSAVIVFPGSNCDRDLAVALRAASGAAPAMVWHKETSLPQGVDVVALPGGFSFGDYLRCGAIAARAPIMAAVVDFARRGGLVLGVCNGFQVLIEAGLLPGSLMRNAGLTFVCKPTSLVVCTTDSPFTSAYASDEVVSMPVAHHDGNLLLPEETLKEVIAEDRVAFRYRDNPNGSIGDIAGLLSTNRRVLGMMPHPERAIDAAHGGTDGQRLFAGIMSLMTAD